ncbi:TetR/AcrR family transcriptional regulator [Curtobacterium sp. SL109]|uniref:TetR/AcrR family transcriptional regulator n=1 Tax=Curtobacterium sp. SL109 TaxID=2994662 RepID=UPI002274804A|nr:TetR/AcrR family transcriptional regulator [Curtobacterium sp. SL109]MCY1696279.1 TetR/AcrR family transcriptional regulator [Curtobacterium sp. SL109]
MHDVGGAGRRDVIVEAAAVEFDRDGYATASIAGIARAAGVSQGSLHRSFPTKHAVALAVIDEQNARTFAAMSAGDPSPIGTLVRASRGIADLLMRDVVVRAGIRISLEHGVLAQQTASFYEQWIAGVVDVFRLAIASGEVSTDLTPEALGGTVVPYFTGVQLVSNVRSGRADLLPVVATMWRVLVHAVVDRAHRERLLRVVDDVFA